MDHDRAALIVKEYRQAADALLWSSGQPGEKAKKLERVNQLFPQMLVIAERVMPQTVQPLNVAQLRGAWALARDHADQIIGMLESASTLAEILGPVGPQLSAVGLHPSVWGPAAPLWDDGHRREAVQAAATSVDLKLQAKLERPDLSGKALVIEAFSLDAPKVGRSRLRMPGYEVGSLDFTSIHEGAMALGRACVQGLRNVVTHRLEQPADQVALEYLAVLSTFARWIDEAEIIRSPT